MYCVYVFVSRKAAAKAWYSFQLDNKRTNWAFHIDITTKICYYVLCYTIKTTIKLYLCIYFNLYIHSHIQDTQKYEYSLYIGTCESNERLWMSFVTEFWQQFAPKKYFLFKNFISVQLCSIAFVFCTPYSNCVCVCV